MNDRQEDGFVRRRFFTKPSLSKSQAEFKSVPDDVVYEEIRFPLPIRLRFEFLSPTFKYWRMSRRIKTELYSLLSQEEREECDMQQREYLCCHCYPMSLYLSVVGLVIILVEPSLGSPPMSIESSVYVLGFICFLSVFGVAYPELVIWNRREKLHRLVRGSIKSMNRTLSDPNWSSRL